MTKSCGYPLGDRSREGGRAEGQMGQPLKLHRTSCVPVCTALSLTLQPWCSLLSHIPGQPLHVLLKF